MKPEQVPDELADLLGEKLYDDAHEGCDDGGCSGGGRPFYDEYARALLIEVLPVHREQIAKEIEAYAVRLMNEAVEKVKAVKPDGFSCTLRAASVQFAAKIVRGETP